MLCLEVLYASDLHGTRSFNGDAIKAAIGSRLMKAEKLSPANTDVCPVAGNDGWSANVHLSGNLEKRPV